MTHDLQHLLEKIQRDGVDKAKADAEKIGEEARAQARAIIASARAEAVTLTAEARSEAEAFERRAEETVRQAARDAVLNVEKAVTTLLTNLLLKDVNSALNSTELVARLAAEAVRAYIGGQSTVEVAASATLANALRARLAAEAAHGVTVITDDTTGAGFCIRLENGRIEHAFTGAAIAEALAKQLRPRLAELMRAN